MLIRRDRAMVAVTIMLDIAFYAGRNATVSAAELAERLGLARRGMEPLLQTLSRADLLISVRGPRGGYRLARARRDITIAEIVSVALAAGANGADSTPSESGAESGPLGPLQTMVVDPIWTELDSAARQTLEQLTLEGLLKRATDAGLQRPSNEPITFAI